MGNNRRFVEESANKGNRITIFKDIIMISLGLLISSFGTALFYQAGMGSSAMATFSDGLHNLLNVSYGTANIISNIVLLLVLFVCNKKMINIGTYLCVFTIGIYIDLGNALFGLLPIASASYFLRLLCVLAGCLMMGVGLALYVAVERGFGALEGLVKFVSDKTNISFDKIKIAQDILLIAFGIMFSAGWGIGTIISAVTIGPIMNIFIGRFQIMLSNLRV